MVRAVEVVAYQPVWRAQFEEEAAVLRALLGPQIVSVHHIGSTSVPGLAAKPIIDVLVQVRDIEAVDGLDAQMRAAGYLPRGENGIPGRRYFRRETAGRHTHHVHVYQVGHPRVRDHLAFRDYLAAHPAQAAAYGALKQELAARYPRDIDAYQAGKGAFILMLVERALAWSERAADGAAEPAADRQGAPTAGQDS